MTTLPKARPGGVPANCGALDCAACSVRHLTFCAELSDEEIGRTGAIADHIRLGNEEMLFQEGDATNYVFNVTSGAVKLYKLLSDGRRQITGFLYPGDFLGLATSKGYSYSAEAIGDVALCRFPRTKLDALFELYPGMERRLFAFANDELAAAQDQMLLLGRKTAMEKIASFLLALEEKLKAHGNGGGDLVLPMTRNDVADYLGLTIETVSRTLTKLKDDKVIELVSARAVRFEQRDALRAMAES